MKRRYAFSVLIIMAVCALVVMTASAEGAWAVDWWTADGGGRTSGDGVTYSLSGTIGQPDAGTMSGGAYGVTGGFWGAAVRNLPPTDIALSNNEISEAQPAATFIGTLTAVDPDPLDTMTFTLVTAGGCASAGNGSFQITGNTLESAVVLDYEAQSSYDICVQVNDGHGHTYNESFVIHVLDAQNAVMTVLSSGAQDGWVRESAAASGVGGSTNTLGGTFMLGDDLYARQYRSILSFNTSVLPDNAIVTGATLNIRLQGINGTNPYAWGGELLVDTHPGVIGTAKTLEKPDFEFVVDNMGLGSIPDTNPGVGGWYSVDIPTGIGGYDYVSKTDLTQLRLRFATANNGDTVTDRLKFFSGNAVKASRPQLIIHYALPSAVINFTSTGSSDGWIRESAEGSGSGGTINVANTTFIVGDDLGDRQHRAVLSFNTAALPDMAVMNSVTLKIKQQSVKGDPFGGLGSLWVDVQAPYFGTLLKLEPLDFAAAGTDEHAVTLPTSPDGTGWYVVSLPDTAFDSINLLGTTQIRLVFDTPSDGDNQLDQLRLFSGNALPSQRPVLIIDYAIP